MSRKPVSIRHMTPFWLGAVVLILAFQNCGFHGFETSQELIQSSYNSDSTAPLLDSNPPDSPPPSPTPPISTPPDSTPPDSTPPAPTPPVADTGGDDRAVWISTLQHKDTLILNAGTMSFGTKKQAAPEFWKFGDWIVENGVTRSYETGVTDGAKLQSILGFHGTLGTTGYATDTLWGKVVGDVRISSKDARHPRLSHVYDGRGIGWVGSPMATGGLDDSRRRAADFVYMSWRFRAQTPLSNMRAIEVANVSGKFKAAAEKWKIGETGKLNSAMYKDVPVNIFGVFEFDGKSWICFTSSASLGSNGLGSATITGDASKAVARTVTNVTAANSPTNFSGKLLRAYETTSGRDGMHVVISTNRMVITANDASGKEVFRNPDTGYGVPSFGTTLQDYDRWAFIEVAIDFSGKGTNPVSVTVDNGTPRVLDNNDLIAKNRQHGPHFNNVGYEPAGGNDMHPSRVLFDEFYQDSTLQRVVIGNAPLYSNSTALELQLPEEWTPSRIKIRLNQGAFDTLEGKYLYIIGPNGKPISNQGIALTSK